jgi:hypothetical protein
MPRRPVTPRSRSEITITGTPAPGAGTTPRTATITVRIASDCVRPVVAVVPRGADRRVFPAEELDATEGAVLVDFAGDRALLREVHEQLGAALERSVLVGLMHWQAEADEAPQPGPAPDFSFAPNEMARRGRGLA